MGRKSHYVQTINHKDIDFLNALRCCGICTKNQAQHFISANRLKSFVLDKTVERCSHVTYSGQRVEVYRLSAKGKEWVRERIDVFADRKFYHSTGVEHDLKLMDKIISLSREERTTMRCEAEIRDEFKERLQELLENRDFDRYDQLYTAMQEHTISMPDLCYGVDCYYEVVTGTYGQAEIEAKMEAVSMVGGNLEMERI